MTTEIVYEVVMRNDAGRVWNGFFSTLKAARAKYFECNAINWKGDIFRREMDTRLTNF